MQEAGIMGINVGVNRTRSLEWDSVSLESLNLFLSVAGTSDSAEVLGVSKETGSWSQPTQKAEK